MYKKLSVENKTCLNLILIFLIILVLNILTPIIADDFGYSLNLDKERLRGLKDIINFQIVHYNYWGGRSIAHTLVQIFLYLPKGIFNILNSFCFTYLIYLIYKICKNNQENKPIFLWIIFLLIYFFVPVFGQNILWLTGACNYLWTTAIVIFFINLFLTNKKNNLFLITIIFILGIISGWTNENTAVGLIVIISLIIITKRKENKKIYPWQISGLIGTSLGFAIMLLAQGNYIRKNSIIENLSLIEKIFTRFLNCTIGIFTYLLPFLVILISLFLILKIKKQNLPKNCLIFIIGTFFTIYSMVLSPTFPKRAWFSSIIFLIIPIISLSYNLELSKKYLKKFKILIIIILALFIIDYKNLLVDINNLNITWKNRIKYIKKHQKDSNIEFSLYETPNRKNPQYGQLDIVKNPLDWPNNEIEKYFSIKSISIK